MSNSQQYNLEVRTEKFAKEVIGFCKQLPQDIISKPIISQLVRSATSIGANYYEANGASSQRDFANKIYLCKKESQETRYWLKLTEVFAIDRTDQIAKLKDECRQLTLIFQRITLTIKNKEIEN